MKGKLAYKDVHGNVWEISEGGEKDVAFNWQAVGPLDVKVYADYIDGVIEEIDDIMTPEWTTEPPAENVQTEELDRGAFPNADN